MHILTLEQAKMEPWRTEYAYRVYTVIIAFLLTLATSISALIGLVYAWRQAAWLGVFMGAWLGFFFALFAWFAWITLRARLAPSNWLIRTQVDGMLVKFRSYLNPHFPDEDPVVFSISYAEIEWVRQHRVIRNIPGQTRGDDTPQRYRFIEMKLRDDTMVKELEDQLFQERQRLPVWRKRAYGRARSMSRHYPVQVTDGLVRIEWGVYPGIKRLLVEIGNRVSHSSPADTLLDYRDIGEKPAKEQEDLLLQLVAAGDRMGAVKTVKMLYGFDTTQAVKFVEELSRAEPRRDDQQFR